jgi:hypothetical protein
MDSSSPQALAQNQLPFFWNFPESKRGLDTPKLPAADPIIPVMPA